MQGVRDAGQPGAQGCGLANFCALNVRLCHQGFYTLRLNTIAGNSLGNGGGTPEGAKQVTRAENELCPRAGVRGEGGTIARCLGGNAPPARAAVFLCGDRRERSRRLWRSGAGGGGVRGPAG